jgi:hypothetical protein
MPERKTGLHGVPVGARSTRRATRLGRASAPMIPHLVHTIRPHRQVTWPAYVNYLSVDIAKHLLGLDPSL